MNKYSPFTFFSLLVVPMAFCVVHAQNSNVPDDRDRFSAMFSQGREAARQSMVQDFAEAQRQNAQKGLSNRPVPSQSQIQQGLNRSAPGPMETTNPPPPPPFVNTAPYANIPVPSANPTNTPSPPPNIYAPPPPPPSAAAAPRAPTPQPAPPSNIGQPPQTATNIYQ